MLILLTGANGQLGSECDTEGRRRGHEMVGLGRAELDITDKEAVLQKIGEVKPDAIIHCAAWTNVDGAEDHPEDCRRINVDGTRNVAEAAKCADAKLIYISTDYVFDGSGTQPWKPEDDPHPLNVYGQSKLDGENAARDATDKHFIVRTSWLYGSHGKNFVKTMLRIGRERDIVRVVNDQIGTPTYSSDLARLLLDMAESECYGTYHAVNTGGYISWYDFTKEIYRVARLATDVFPVNSAEYGAKAVRPKNSRMDCAKLKEMGFAPLPCWNEALKRSMVHLL